MPTYEYSCKSCGQHLEVVQSFKDHALTRCPNCGGDLKKVFGNIGIMFKGSGFYKNDSRAAHSTTKPAVASSGTEAAASSGEAAKSAASDGTPAKTAAAGAPTASTSSAPSSGAVAAS
jgi:putative FmdB family regulatory protein